MTDIPIVDAHQHFWDLARNYLPWLCDPEPIPFRYGDYSALRRNYMPSDYFRDAAGHRVVKTVYVETEWDPRDPVGETRWLQGIIDASGFPHGIVAGARLDNPEVEAVLAGHAGFSRVRGIRHKPRAAPSPDRVEKNAPGSMGDPAWRRGYSAAAKLQPVVRPADPLVASRGGGGAGARLSGHSDHPEPHRPARRSQPRGPGRLAAGDGDARGLPQQRDQDLGPGAARPTLDGRGQRAGRARHDRDLRRRAVHVREQFPGRWPLRQRSMPSSRASRQSCTTCPRPTSAACSTTMQPASTVSRAARAILRPAAHAHKASDAAARQRARLRGARVHTAAVLR